MSIYTDAQKVASQLLKEFRQGVITLVKGGAVADNTDEPWNPGASDPDETYVLDAVAKTVGEEFVDGSTVLATDAEVTCAAFEDEPDVGDTIVIDGNSGSVIKVMRIPRAGAVIAWRMIVRL